MSTKPNTYVEAQVSIFFTEGRVCCDLCPLLETYSRKQCRRTGEYILDSKTTGLWCPLDIKEIICEKISPSQG